MVLDETYRSATEVRRSPELPTEARRGGRMLGTGPRQHRASSTAGNGGGSAAGARGGGENEDLCGGEWMK